MARLEYSENIGHIRSLSCSFPKNIFHEISYNAYCEGTCVEFE